MYLLWAVLGACICLVLERSLFAGIVGVLLGLLWARQGTLLRSLRKLEAAQESQQPSTEVTPQDHWAADESRSEPSAPAEPMPLQPMQSVFPVTSVGAAFSQPPPLPDPEEPTYASSPVVPESAPAPHVAPEPDPVTVLVHKVWAWFTGGNVPVKIGVLILFAGVGALLKYAHDAHLFIMPVSLRLGLVAAVAVAGLAFGWRQRDRRRGFGLALQGGGIGVLVMVVFAALRLYGMVSPAFAFALLIVLVAGVGLLAVLQDALALAVLGLLAGFAAPMLTATGQGSHVSLFGFYTVLNLAVFGVAWKKSWRILNLLGFVATFVIGISWGVLRYRSADFASTEPFLILHFLLYLMIPWLYLRHRPDGQKRWLDAGLLFGTPLISLLAQGALLDWQAIPMALSAVLAALVYVLAAWSMRGHSALGLLQDSWAILAAALATLAVPLAFHAGVTAGVFALEGAGMVWLGLRQGRRALPWCGLGMQVLAAGSVMLLWLDADWHPHLAVLNREFLATLLLAVAGALIAWLFQRHRQGWLALGVGAWSLLWWCLDTLIESLRFLGGRELLAAWWMLAAVTAWGLAEVTRAVGKTEPAGAAGGWVAASFSALILVFVLACLGTNWQPLSGWLLLATMLSAVAGWRMLGCLHGHAQAAVFAQTGWWWRWALLAGVALAEMLAAAPMPTAGWESLALLLPLVALWFAVLRETRGLERPLAGIFPMSRRWLSHTLAFALGGVFVIALFAEGRSSPLPFLPLFNPAGLLQWGIGVCAVLWFADRDTPAGMRATRPLVLGVAGLALLTSMTLRSVHHYAGVPWDDALMDSSLAQLSLTVVWSLFGVLAWLWGSRRRQYPVWLAGAVTMGVVLLKLLLVDRDSLGSLFGIASFIAYGILCVVVGYFAPRPPRRVTVESAHAA